MFDWLIATLKSFGYLGIALLMFLNYLLFYTTFASAPWVGLLTYSGYVLGRQYELVDEYLAPVSKIMLPGLSLAFGFAENG